MKAGDGSDGKWAKRKVKVDSTPVMGAVYTRLLESEGFWKKRERETILKESERKREDKKENNWRC